ncbi:MAG TPA: hypothetical protein DCR14_00935, partial [Acidimicrobiaceae bacterium]|nr:hypothetical protein [Acidimicrobiaceae bacterium]
MGLFSKKAKPPKPGTHKLKPEERSDDQQPAAQTGASAAVPTTNTGTPPKPGKPEKAVKPGKPEKPGKPPKVKKGAIDPMDFLALKTELADVRARLEASEQAKTIVESRLAALDATTTAMSAGTLGGDDLRARVHSLEAQLEAVADTASAANITAEAAAAKATTAATVASEAASGITALASNPAPAVAADAL